MDYADRPSPPIDSLAEQGIGYVPFFPLGGFTPLQSETLSNDATHDDPNTARAL
jgi:hypothetical protein